MRVTINKLGMNGEGVCRGTCGEFNNKVGFVPYALEGEEVDVEILSNNKKFFVGKLNGVLIPSLDRVNPQCKYFGMCGGCDIQHLKVDKQLEFKQNLIKESLYKIANIDISICDVVKCNNSNYRNKMAWPYVKVGKESVLGMYESSSHNIVDIDECCIADDKLNLVFQITKEYLCNNSYEGYDFHGGGDIKYVVARINNDDVLITLVTTRKIDFGEYYAIIKKHFKNVGISIVISSSDNDIMKGKYIHCYGLEKLQIKEFGLEFGVDNRGFLQVNSDVMMKLYSSVLNEIIDGDSVIDAYSGAGLLSAIIARKASKVIGIEINKSASESAKLLCRQNQINNVTPICGNVKTYLGNCLTNNESVVVLDPPRSGCDKFVVDSLLKFSQKIKKIIYISCNPATLARDLKLLIQKFDINKVVPFDMFPNTKHVETFVVLERKE